MPQVISCIFKEKGRIGDFAWMIKQSRFALALFVFNDNEEQFLQGDCIPGMGNAIIRPYQCMQPPRAAGIPTGTRGRGYQRLTKHVREIIDLSIKRIRHLVATGRYTQIYYSADKYGNLGTGVFNVGNSVKKYIVTSLQILDTSSKIYAKKPRKA